MARVIVFGSGESNRVRRVLRQLEAEVRAAAGDEKTRALELLGPASCEQERTRKTPKVLPFSGEP